MHKKNNRPDLKYELHIEVEDSEEGQEMIKKLYSLLVEFKHEYKYAYVQGWVGPEGTK